MFFKSKVQNKLFQIFIGRSKYKKLKKNLLNSGKKTVLFISSYSTLANMKQRPEHIFDEFTNRNYQVVLFDKHIASPIKTKNNLWMAPLSFFTPLAGENDLKKIIMTISTHDSLPNIEKILFNCIQEGTKVIYEHLDDFDLWKDAPKTEKMLRKRFQKICRNENVIIVATAEHLLKQAVELRGSHKNVCLIKNAVNLDDFCGAINPKIPSELTDVKKKKKPIIGYYGVINDAWFDYALMKEVISHNKQFEFVLIGPLVGKGCEELLKYENCTYIPKIPYEKIAQYAMLFDIATIPFQLNNITKCTSPVKLFEYMALSKPIVTTPLKECLLYKSCLIAHNADEFSEQLHKAIKLNNDEKYMNTLKTEAEENTWKKRVDILEKLLGSQQ